MGRILFLFSIASALTASEGESNWKEICRRATAAPLTSPSAADNSLSNCDGAALYYGFGRAADPAAALRCGYYQRAHPQPSVGDPFYGPGVLTMLYANARGVARDYNLAIRFACENTWAADAEMEGRIGHLEKLRDTHAQETKFDLCDDATSGLMEGACESIRQKVAGDRRQPALDAFAARLSAPAKIAFQALAAANDGFIAARTAKEVDLSGTGRAAFALEEEGRLREQFLIDLRRFAKGAPPAADFRLADQNLNAAYQTLMRTPASAWYGTVRPEGIHDTEVAWLKLRDAWVEFARAAWPRLNADAVRAQITRLRVHQLQSLNPR